jgi:hypothetical protein
VHDTTAPVAPTIANAIGECSVTVTAPTASDNCAGNITGTTSDPLTYSIQGTYTVHWSFYDGNGNTSTANQTVIVDDVTVPVAPTIANATGECSVTVTAPTASDNCAGNIIGTTSDPLTYSSQGTYTLHWSFNDGNGNISTANQTVIVDDVTAPIISCPANINVNVDPNSCSAVVTYTAPIGTDNCSGATTTQTAGLPSGSTFPVGTTINTFKVTDVGGNTAECSFTVTVTDNILPVITLKPAIDLWSPNHKYATINTTDLVLSVTDNCSASLPISSVAISQVSSDEPENINSGDGNTWNDIVIAADCKSVQLRAERDGSKNGRVYTLTLKIRDVNGNVGTAFAKVNVPKSQGSGPAVEGPGPGYTVLSTCP